MSRFSTVSYTHLAHAAIVLGAAMILSQLKKDLKGNVRFIFQPGEESSGGARVTVSYTHLV